MQFEDMVSISAGPSQLIAALCDEIGLEHHQPLAHVGTDLL